MRSLVLALAVGAGLPATAQENSQPPAGQFALSPSGVVNMAELAARPAVSSAPGLVETPLMMAPRKGDPVLTGLPEPTVRARVALAATGVASPAPSASFQGLGDSGRSIPPDTQGAVGPNHLMVALNTDVRILNKSGTTLSTTTLTAFWQAFFPGISVFDPKVIYDPVANRWFFLVCANARRTDSAILVAVSANSDPTGSWTTYRIPADSSGVNWADFSIIGVNSKWVVFSANMFSVSASRFSNSRIWVLPKGDALAGRSLSFVKFFDTTAAFTMSPAIDYDNSLTVMPLVDVAAPNSGGKGSLRISTISGALGSERFNLAVASPFINSTWADFPATSELGPQADTAIPINVGDGRIGAPVMHRNGSLWLAHNVFLPANAPSRCAVQWWEIRLDGTVRQSGRVDEPGQMFAYPSIAVNRNNDVLLGYSRFSPSQFASANYSFRFGTDAAGTMRDDRVFKAGEAKYVKTFSGDRNRWGDYSSTWVDPANDTDLWTLQEYAATPSGGSDRFGVFWARVTPSVVDNTPTLTSFTPTSGGASTNVTLNGTKFTGATSVLFNGTPATFSVASATQITTTVPAGATTGTLSVTTPGGTATSSASFTVVALPAITSLTPASGAIGSSVVVTGANFTGATSVKFNGTPATFTINSATQITASVPGGATSGRVTVVTGAGTATSSANFTVTAVPGISAFSPVTGGVGTSVVLTGANLVGVSSVKFGGLTATFTANSATQITTTVPANATTGRITVTTTSGIGTSAANFTVVLGPTLASFTPTSSPVGTRVTLTGNNFTGATAVRFNGVAASTFTVDSATQITATVGNGTTSGTVSVVTPGGTVTSTGTFTVIGTPPNDNFAAAQVLNGGAGTVTGTTVAATREVGEPNHAGNRGGLSIWYRWTAPSNGVWNFDTAGSSFDTLLAVYTGTAVDALALVTANDDAPNTLTSRVMFSATSNTVYRIAVAGYDGASGSVTLNFNQVFVAPVISSFSPTNGAIGSSVTVSGSNFVGVSAVTFNNTAATFSVLTATQLVASVPVGATTGALRVTTPGGIATSAASFTLRLAPTNDAFAQAMVIAGTAGTATGSTTDASKEAGEPNHAGNAGGRSIWFSWIGRGNGVWTFDTRGSSFDTLLGIYTGTSVGSLTAITSNDDDQALRTSRVQFNAVSNTTYFAAVDGSGGAAGSVVLNWTFTPFPPGITGVSPDSGRVGSQVVITGTNFTGVNRVRFGGVDTKVFTTNSATAITATVPFGARSGPITVTSTNGTGTSAVNFTILTTPENDHFTNATRLTGASAIITGRTVGATKETLEPNHARNFGGSSVWYRWTAPSSGSFTIDLAGSRFDTTLAVYTGSVVTNLTEIASDDDSGGNLTSRVTFGAVASTEYRIAVDGYNGEAGDFSLRAFANAAQAVLFATGFETTEGYSTSLPLGSQDGWNLTGTGGNGIVANVFSGLGQQAYIGYTPPAIVGDALQMARSFQFVPDTNSRPVVRFSVLMEIDDSTNGAYDYFIYRFFDTAGARLFSVVFDNSTLDVGIALDDDAGFVATGTSFRNNQPQTLTVTLDFARNLWNATLNNARFASNQPISTLRMPAGLGSIAPVWLPASQASPGDNYLLLDNFVVTSEPTQAPAIALAPVAQALLPGDTAIFGVVATGAGDLAYQWRRNGTDLVGETNATLTLYSVLDADAGAYAAVVSNLWGVVSTTAANLTVTTPPATMIGSAWRNPEGSFQLISIGTSRVLYTVEATTDFIEWIELTTEASTNGVINFLDREAINSNSRFYRVRESR